MNFVSADLIGKNGQQINIHSMYKVLNNMINTDKWSQQWRDKGIDVANKRILITDFIGSQQEQDLTEPANCNGLGRIRHFKRETRSGWPNNPLPIDPALKALWLDPTDALRAQVFQNAVCNWRCWYCFVPFDLLSANPEHSKWVTASELIDLYLDQENVPMVIDLSGGQPDLTPEFVPWIVREIQNRDLDRHVYIWSDDNLSTDYFWRYLSFSDIELLHNARNYGRVACFKGYDSESFAFNTKAEPDLFDRQFDLFSRFVFMEFDIYAYVTFTSVPVNDIKDKVKIFVDRLQDIHVNLPLRTVPLEIQMFTPVHSRINPVHTAALEFQHKVAELWCLELETRFTSDERTTNIADVKLK